MSAARLLGRIRRRLLAIGPSELDFARLGFEPGDPSDRAHLAAIASAFAEGYHAAHELGASRALEERLALAPPSHAGFGYEGAAMALAMQDRLVPWPARAFERLAAAGGRRFVHLMHVGAGWASARLRRRPVASSAGDLLAWLRVDGFGFHSAFFDWRAHRDGRGAPRSVPRGAVIVFDQGVGRATWFGCQGSVERAARAIESLPAGRRPSLYSGLGLAVAYAGRATGGAAAELAACTSEHRASVALGVAFAAEARALQGHADAPLREACDALWREPPEAVSAYVRAAREAVGGGTGIADYVRWQELVRVRAAGRR